MRSQLETVDVYKALVAALATSLVPTTIMSVTVVGIGLFASASTRSPLLLAATVAAGLASAAKIVLLLAHAPRTACGLMDEAETRLWETRHAVSTVGVATSIGAVSSLIFATADLSLQMLAPALVFGYCSGIVSRVSIRPRIACAALTMAAVPTIVCAVWVGDAPHRITAVMFGVFYFGAMESVEFTYRAAARQIRQGLDMATLARHDPLTGLFNRLGLREAFRALPADKRLATAVHCLDLDGFKAVNDQFGHAAGDRLLCTLGRRLRLCAAETDVVARTGGDEFVVVQANVRDRREVQDFARRIGQALGAPVDLGDRATSVGVSLGYAVRDAVSADLDAMLGAADVACYGVKRQGGGVAGEAIEDAAVRRPAWVQPAEGAPARSFEGTGAAATER